MNETAQLLLSIRGLQQSSLASMWDALFSFDDVLQKQKAELQNSWPGATMLYLTKGYNQLPT